MIKKCKRGCYFGRTCSCHVLTWEITNFIYTLCPGMTQIAVFFADDIRSVYTPGELKKCLTAVITLGVSSKRPVNEDGV